MKWQITAKTGYRRGSSWDLGSRPITFGRSLQCDITIADPTVSRRHCEVSFDGTQVRFRDLGSRNISLVNGRMVHDCVLRVGDELALGTDSFIVSQAASTVATNPTYKGSADDTTVSLGGEVSLEHILSTPLEGLHTASAQEMVRLFQFSQHLQRASSIHDFAAVCLASLETFFPSPAMAIFCIQQDENQLRIYPRSETLPDPVINLLTDCLRSGRSVLKRERTSRIRNSRQMCISPLHTDEGCRAALAILSRPPGILFDEDDLARLDLISDVASLNLTALRRRSALADSTSESSQTDDIAFLGKSEEAALVRQEIGIAAKNRLPTLITGEAGTGKGLAAQLIHRQSPKPRGPFVSVDCTVIAGTDFDQTLLGVERPVIAHGRLIEAGLLDQSNGGTLVLREIDRLTEENLRKVCRIFSQRSFVRIGSEAEVSFHGRVIATSCQDLDRLVSAGGFSAELLRIVGRQRIYIAPLRQRHGDMRAIASFFLKQERVLNPKISANILDYIMESLADTPLWRNARELRQNIRRAILPKLSDHANAVTPTAARHGSAPLKDPELAPLENVERALIATVVRQCGGDTARAAEILGIPLAEVTRVDNAAHLARQRV